MAIKNMSRRGRALTAVGAGCVAAGVLAASAASLGTLSVSDLGTTANVVAACQNSGLSLTTWAPFYSGIATTATSPSATSGSSYWLTGAVVAGIDTPCHGQKFKLVLAQSDGASLVETTGTVTAAASQNITLGSTVDSKSVYQATLTIYE